MKKIALDFARRGMVSMGFGPIILAIFYLIMDCQGLVGELTVDRVCIGIFSLTALAFIAGGMNVIYQAERLPLMAAVSIHGAVLYLCYLATYLANGWLDSGMLPILVFTGIFGAGYLIIWAVIYLIIRRGTDRINEGLKKQQRRRAP